MPSKLNILITGSSGFIGKNLVEYLSRSPHCGKYKLFYPAHKELELLDADAVTSFIKSNRIGLIIHTASVGGSRKTNYDEHNPGVFEINMRMFFNLERMLEKGMRMIFLGSGAEYGRGHFIPKMKEDYFNKFIPADAYGFYKYACSRYIAHCEDIVNLRLFGVFGKFENYLLRFISNTIVKNLLGLDIVIKQNVYFDYLYIDDLNRIIEHFINKKPKYKFYNVASGRTVGLATIADKVNSISSRPSKVIIKNSGLNTEYSADTARLRREIKNFRFTPFDIALKNLYSWHEQNLDKIDKDAVIRDEFIQYCKVKE